MLFSKYYFVSCSPRPGHRARARLAAPPEAHGRGGARFELRARQETPPSRARVRVCRAAHTRLFSPPLAEFYRRAEHTHAGSGGTDNRAASGRTTSVCAHKRSAPLAALRALVPRTRVSLASSSSSSLLRRLSYPPPTSPINLFTSSTRARQLKMRSRSPSASSRRAEVPRLVPLAAVEEEAVDVDVPRRAPLRTSSFSMLTTRVRLTTSSSAQPSFACLRHTSCRLAQRKPCGLKRPVSQKTLGRPPLSQAVSCSARAAGCCRTTRPSSACRAARP